MNWYAGSKCNVCHDPITEYQQLGRCDDCERELHWIAGIECKLAGEHGDKLHIKQESHAITYFCTDYTTGEVDGGDCADAAWELQQLYVPHVEAIGRPKHVTDDIYLDWVSDLCKGIYGPNTLEHAICYMRS